MNYANVLLHDALVWNSSEANYFEYEFYFCIKKNLDMDLLERQDIKNQLNKKNLNKSLVMYNHH